MCGRFTSRTPIDDVADHFDVEEVVAPDLGLRYNVAPTDEVYAVAEVDGSRRLGALRWGLVPRWADDPGIGSRMINARVETVAEKPAFAPLLARRRCLVPADGFYEWRRPAGEQPRQAFHIRRRDGGILAFAALWDSWRPPGDDPRLVSCTIITGPATGGVEGIHPRAPVALPPSVWATWLDVEVDDRELLRALLEPTPDLVAVAVSDAVNDVRHDGAHLVEPVGDAARATRPSGAGP